MRPGSSTRRSGRLIYDARLTLRGADHARDFQNILSAIGNTPLVTLEQAGRPGRRHRLREVRVHEPGRRRSRTGWRCTSSTRPSRRGCSSPAAPSSRTRRGNTGMGVAMVAAVKGYQCIFTMPDKMSHGEDQPRSRRLGARGGGDADQRRRPRTRAATTRPPSASPARRRARSTLNQYHNPDNIEAHYLSTGPEIWKQTDGRARLLRRRAGHRRHDVRARASS